MAFPVPRRSNPMITCPTPLPAKDRILLGHGSGGKLSADLLRDVFLPVFRSPVLGRLDDQAVLQIGAERLAFTTDSFVVKPLFFRGGDIGSLAVHGTINDLAMGGAEPLYLSAAIILEEGLSIDLLARIAESMGKAAEAAGIEIVTGDTKVVEKGSGDGVFINTTGIGRVPPGIHLSAANARPGDLVLLSWFLGDHGITILSERQDIGFDAPIESDSAALHTLVRDMLAASPAIRCMRDPTRGGLSSAINEIAALARVGVELNEPAIPVREVVRGACELLGFDPLYVANEAKLVAIAPTHAPPPAGPPARPHRHGARQASRHGHHENRLRHHPNRRHAPRRPTPEDLLMLWHKAPPCASERSSEVPACSTCHMKVLTFLLFSSSLAAAGPLLTVGPNGRFATVQAAVDAAAPHSVIHIAAGVYKERVVVPYAKPFLTFRGDDPGTTVITNNSHTGLPGPKGPINTFATPTVFIQANDFTAENLTFENSAGNRGQADRKSTRLNSSHAHIS